MNRKQRERHERGPLLPSRLSVPTLEGRGNLSLDSSSNRFGSTRDTPFFVRDFRAFRGENYNGHSLGGAKVFLFLLDRPPFSLHNPL